MTTSDDVRRGVIDARDLNPNGASMMSPLGPLRRAQQDADGILDDLAALRRVTNGADQLLGASVAAPFRLVLDQLGARVHDLARDLRHALDDQADRDDLVRQLSDKADHLDTALKASDAGRVELADAAEDRERFRVALFRLAEYVARSARYKLRDGLSGLPADVRKIVREYGL